MNQIRYPKLNPAGLMLRFFMTLREWDEKLQVGWKWDSQPIRVRQRYDANIGPLLSSQQWTGDDSELNPSLSWNDYMPLITPAYPTMNSLHSVSEPTFNVMMTESGLRL